MTLLRNSSLKQLTRINDEIKKQGGKTDLTVDSEKGLVNGLWIHNPIDANKSGKRRIATIDQFIQIDIPDADTSVKMKNENMKNENMKKKFPHQEIKDALKKYYDSLEDLKEYSGVGEDIRENMNLNENKVANAIQKAIDDYFTTDDDNNAIEIISQFTNIPESDVIEILNKSNSWNAMEHLMQYEPKNENKHNMKNIQSFDKMFENGPNDTPIEIMRNMKTIANWHSEGDTPKREMNQLQIGKFIDTGKVKGYINRIEGKYIYIDSIIEPLGVTKVKLKDAVKGSKTPKKDKVVSDISIEGPNNKSLGNAPKEGGGYSPKVDAKGTKSNDQKLSNKINKEKSIKKFTDMSKDFDSTKIKTKKKDVSTKIDGKGEETKDSKSLHKIFKTSKILKLSDLSNELDSGKMKKKKTTLKPETVDSEITKKTTKVKKFSSLKSDIETGPNKKK